jgi:serine protease
MERRPSKTTALALAAGLVALSLLFACQSGPTPTPAVTSVSIDQPNSALVAGDTLQLSVTVTATGGASQAVIWSSADDGVATVGASGLVTALTPGTTTITAISAFDGSRSDGITITVTAAPTGTISGSLSVVASGSAERGGSLAARERPMAASAMATADIVPGDVIVRFVDGLRAASPAMLEASGVRLQSVRPLALPNASLYRAVGTDRADTLALVDALRARPDVLYAEPNLVLQSLLTPNDPFYANQWHYPAIGLPDAWDVTTGSVEIVVAVGDTGILHAGDASPATHPDLVGRVLPGYDFISDPAVANDGGGRDPDPYDVGDEPGGQSSYHGTHVAGTIGAATNGGVGVAGVDWSAKLLPVRMLGVGGGSLVDIVEGTLWAAGLPVAGVPANPTPAHVINLSLGGTAPCSSFTQEAFDRIAADAPNAAIVVVAAGNENADAGFATPANCGGVIAVGATDLRGHRAPYSNYGSRVDVMAPGGDLTADRNADGFPDGVLSLSRNDASSTFNYVFQNGTSMAAPHVAGVISLMKALDPDLSLTDALATLTATASPLTAAACDRPSGGDCGAGLIDAAAAVTAIADGDVPTPGGGAVAYDPNPVDYGTTLVTRDIRLTNTGDAPVDWFLEEYVEDPANPGEVPEGAVYFAAGSPTGGSLAPAASVTTTIGIDRGLVTAPGSYRIELLFLVDGVEQPLTVRFRTATAAPTPTGQTLVFALQETVGDDVLIAGSRAYPSFVSTYAFSALAGSNDVFAWSDEDGDGELDEGDFFGNHPLPVAVTAGVTTTGVDIEVAPVLSLDEAFAPLIDRLGSREAVVALLRRVVGPE